MDKFADVEQLYYDILMPNTNKRTVIITNFGKEQGVVIRPRLGVDQHDSIVIAGYTATTSTVHEPISSGGITFARLIPAIEQTEVDNVQRAFAAALSQHLPQLNFVTASHHKPGVKNWGVSR
jgi:hypothetical protein